MNPRLAKELRPLWLPWALATAAAIGHLVAHGEFVAGLAGFAFVAGVLVLAAMPTGAELHERTLTLLLSQPIERARLWREKLFAASLMIVSLGIVHGVAVAVMGRLNPLLALLCIAFAVTAICSVGYHTLATRSVLVGIASAIGLPYSITLCTFLLARYFFEVELHLSEGKLLALVIVASLVYSVYCLRISRRQFVGLELVDGAGSRSAELPAALVPRALSNLFRCQPTGVTLNLVRKEVCLHKPLFLVSAIFTAAWLLTLLLMIVHPAWHDNCVATLHGLTGAQVVLMSILGGCVALGDDKALGTSMWQLTLPVSMRRQWFIKLLTAYGTTFALAAILPTFLAVLTLFKAKVGLLAVKPGDLFGPTIPFLGVFVLGFWSASMTPNTVRAALTSVFGLFGIGMVAALGASLAEVLFRRSPIQSDLVDKLLTYYQVNSETLAQHPGVVAYPMLLVCILFVLAALIQSHALFRRGRTPKLIRVKYALILATIVFVGSFWCSDLGRSLFMHRH